MVVDATEWAAIQQVVDRLKQIYPAVPEDTVATVVLHDHARFDGRPIRDFVPLFVERRARQELRTLG
jgi:hypothetical protein